MRSSGQVLWDDEPRTVHGRDPIQMYDLLPLTTVLDWKTQRRLWEQVLPA